MAFLAFGLAIANPFVRYYVPLTFGVIGVIYWLDRSVQFSVSTLWALTAIAVGNLAGGIILIDGEPLYELGLVDDIRYDKFYHAAATGVGAWASYEAVSRWSRQRRPALILVAVMMASGAGAFVEIVEYFGTVLLDSSNVGGYDNNMQDLIANTTGATVGALAAYRWQRLQD